MPLQSTRIRHVYNRIGFGPNLNDFKKIQTLTQVIDQAFNDSREIKHLSHSSDISHLRSDLAGMSKEEKQEFIKTNRMDLMELNASWIHHMAYTRGQIREKMTFFWHDHFACQLKIAKLVHLQNATLREHALGTYPELLHAISKDPGMLLFLNNQQNVKAHPNENFARELMELFTLGRGYYTEKDVKEAARAFTGWSILPNGSFFFRKRQHDFGNKEFLGRRGNFSGEDIIDILLEHPRTAEFLTEKLYRFFVCHTPDPDVISSWSNYFYESGYNISSLLRKIFESDHFYSEPFIGSRIKSPVEYLVSMMRLLNLRFGSHEGPVYIQKVLGQMLFFPPNISGWPDHHAWIDSSSLMTRLNIPKIIFKMGAPDVLPKEAFAGNEDIFLTRMLNNKIDVQIDWKELTQYIHTLPPAELQTRLKEYVLSVPSTLDAILPKNKISSEEDLMKYLLHLMSTPEFQLC